MLYFPIGQGPIYHGKTIVQEVETGQKLNIKIRDKASGRSYNAVDVFPEYIFISIPQFDDKLEKEIDEWLYVLKHEEVRPEFKSPSMNKVLKKLDILKMPIGARDEYYNYIKQVSTYKNALETAIEKGEARGRTKERAEGRIEGKAEVIKNMLKQSISKTDIAQILQL